MVEVTQADRDAALNAKAWTSMDSLRYWGNSKQVDEVEALAKAFARHRIETLEGAARVGYHICAETRHVSLGDKVSEAIRAMKGQSDD